MTFRLGPDFGRLIRRFSPEPQAPLAVAASGGSDSTALLHLCAEWANRSGYKLLVLTVDHQLRSASAAEANGVAQLAETLGAAHQTLVWDTPRAGQNAARDARHRLLAEAAQQAGAKVVLLGHTLNDVIETIHIREQRDTPTDRLAGPMLAAPAPVWPEGYGITLLRPLILTQRDALRRWLSDRGAVWLDDPSNENAAYERIRVRQGLAAQTSKNEAHAQRAKSLMKARQVADQMLGQALTAPEHITIEGSGLVRLRLGGLPESLKQRMTAQIARICGGHDRAPRAEAVQVLLNTTLSRSGDRATLGGAWFQRTADELLVGRDPGKVLADSSSDLWDGRFKHDPSDTQIDDEVPFLLRQSIPSEPGWRPVLAERIALEAKAYQTLLVNPVHR